MGAAPTPSRTTWLRLAPTAAFALVGSVVVAVVIQRSFVAAHRSIGWAVACAMVALLLEPVISFLDRRVARFFAVGGTLLAVIGIAAVVSLLVVRQLRDSVDSLRGSAPEAARRLEDKVAIAKQMQLGARVTEFVNSIDSRLQRATLQRLGTVPTYLITGILMLFFLAYGKGYVRGAIAQVPGEGRRAAVQRIVRRGVTRGRNYLLLAIAQMVLVTVICEVVFRSADLPADVVLSLIVGVIGSIPYFGIAIGGLPALLLAYGFEGTGTALVVAGVLAALQLVEGLVVRPRVDRRTVPVGPFLPLSIGLLGYQLYGSGGAVYGYALLVISLALFDAYTYDRPAGAEAATEPASPTSG